VILRKRLGKWIGIIFPVTGMIGYFEEDDSEEEKQEKTLEALEDRTLAVLLDNGHFLFQVFHG